MKVGKMLSLILLMFLGSLVSLSQQQQEQTSRPVIETESGTIEGLSRVLANNKSVNVFLSIPFAQPPVGELRFKKAIPVEKWNGTYNATYKRDSCTQIDFMNISEDLTMSEDCLYLNIWQPISDVNTTSNPLSVMFWIHGGGFQVGSIFQLIYESDYLSTLGDVIVVTTNYRLGPFGFLYGGSQDAPGNVGLHDQLLALKWVKDNIASFGGNPNSITIFGESAGAMSVGAHVLSPLSNGLFQRAIIQSGTPNSVIGSSSIKKAVSNTRDLAIKVKCFGKELAEQVECLKNKTVEEIILGLTPNVSASNSTESHFFNPVYGDEFLPIKPSEALKLGNLNQVDLLFGHTRDEGTLFMIEYFLDSRREKLVITPKKARKFIIGSFQSFGLSFGAKVAEFYLKGISDNSKRKLFKAVADSFGDFHLTCTTVLFGELAAKWNKNNTSYAYMLAHGPTHDFVGKDLQDVIGVTHSDDLQYVYGIPLKYSEGFTQYDKQMSHDLINIWTTFAKTGHIPALGNNVTWKTAIDEDELKHHIRYMELKPDYQMIETGYPKCDKFWKQYIQ